MNDQTIIASTRVNDTLRNLITGAGSRFGAVVFRKKDGTLRKLVFQHAKDNSSRVVGSELGERMSATFARNNPDMMKAWDHQKQAWRTVNLDAIVSLRVHGATFRVGVADGNRFILTGE